MDVVQVLAAAVQVLVITVATIAAADARRYQANTFSWAQTITSLGKHPNLVPCE